MLAHCSGIEVLDVEACSHLEGTTLGALTNIRELSLTEIEDLDFDNLLLLANCAHLRRVNLFCRFNAHQSEQNAIGDELAQAVRDARRAAGDAVVVTFSPQSYWPYSLWTLTVAPAPKRAAGSGGGGKKKRARKT